jgi:hypothetical protein
VTTQGEDACGFYGGYHNETFITGNSHVLFAVVLQLCSSMFGGSTYNDATTTASHEMIEAATDPHAQSDNGYVGLDQDHYSWSTWLQGQTELADMCEGFDQEEYRDPFGFDVQRSWSNASAIAGHDPCVPRPDSPYFNVTPLDLEDISITPLKGKTVTKAKGYTIPVGTTKTIRLGFYSDASFPSWDFTVVEGGGFGAPMEPQTTINVKQTVGGNGDVAEVDITVNKLIGPDTSILLTAVSHAPNTVAHYMPILLSGR